MDFPLSIPPVLRSAVPAGSSVLVALSGGVDSSVALALLHELGCELFAVTFKNFCYGEDTASSERSCCSLEAIEDARRIAHRFRTKHWVTDVTALFQEKVIEPFVREYATGRTPNPCLSCNATVRFPELVRLADQLGLDLVATGHYARLERREGELRLLRGIDTEKDQAYFLYRIDRRLFPRMVFPLGWYRKEEVRRAARALSLPVASKHESQEICFVPTGDRSFLFDTLTATTPGDIVDRRGEILGRHKGLVYYTVGQRRGLGIGGGEPFYVLDIEEERNRLVVGTERELAVQRITCDNFVAAIAEFPATIPVCDNGSVPVARIRHRHSGAAVASWQRTADRIVVELSEPVKGVAPGQSLVLYQAEQVLGGGRIRETG